MELRLRLTWPGEKDNDYTVWDGDKKVGRMYLTITTIEQGQRWIWTVYGSAVRGGTMQGYVPNGMEPSREDAMAAFKTAWTQVREYNEAKA